MGRHQLIDLSPGEIRFMHDSINSRFCDGSSVNGTIYNIENGKMDVYDLPLIRVVCKDGYYYAFDNRRLYVYRVLHYRGFLDTVTVKLASIKQFRPERFTTENNGKSVVVCRGKTLKHSGFRYDDYDDYYSDSDQYSDDFSEYDDEVNKDEYVDDDSDVSDYDYENDHDVYSYYADSSDYDDEDNYYHDYIAYYNDEDDYFDDDDDDDYY